MKRSQTPAPARYLPRVSPMRAGENRTRRKSTMETDAEEQSRARFLGVGASLALALFLAACAGPMSPSPSIEHTEIVTEQWEIAQNALAPAVPQAYFIEWTSFQWEAYDGPVPCGDHDGIPNGCLLGRTIRWNINTPGVIQHEAAHAILKSIAHPCWKYVSLDSGRVTLHWQKDKSPYCEKWIKANF